MRDKTREDCEGTVTTALNHQTKEGVGGCKAEGEEGCDGGIKEHFVF